MPVFESKVGMLIFMREREPTRAHATAKHSPSLILCMLFVKCLLPARARVTHSRDQATMARSTHLHLRPALVGELHAARSRGTPTLPALELRLPNEKGNLSGETTFSVSGGLRE